MAPGLVELPDPYSFELSTERFRAFGPDPVNLWQDGGLYRVFDGREVRIEPARGGVRIEPADGTLSDAVRRFLGAPFDVHGFEELAAGDETLARLVGALRGFRPPLVPDPFEMLVTSITAQQVSLVSALAVRTRLVVRFGEAARRAHAFPDRGRLACATPEELTALGFSRRKAEYVVGLARGELELDSFDDQTDEEVKMRLTALPGIGEWTADWFLARHLGRPDAWPAGDLGLRKAVSFFFLAGRDVSAEEVRAFGERFSPYRNLAAQYLLTALRLHSR